MITKADSSGHDRTRVIISGRVIFKEINRVMIILERDRLSSVFIRSGQSQTEVCWTYHEDPVDSEARSISTSIGNAAVDDNSLASKIFDSIIYESVDVIWEQVRTTAARPTWRRRESDHGR